MNAILKTNDEPTRADQRLGAKYRFDDPNMDLFFMAALSWGPTGGLDIGEAFYVATKIQDGDAASWVRAFTEFGDLQAANADEWKRAGRTREAGEARLKAFASYRSAWQFAAPGAEFASIYRRQRACFGAALAELSIPATFFTTQWNGGELPGMFVQNADPDAPVILVVGGAGTSFEDLFLGTGRNLLERGYSVAIADLPGQGITQASGLHWQVEAEKPISAIVDVLVERFGARPGRIALLGLSLGGYFVTRAAGHEPRFATVVASTPFPNPGELFALSVQSATTQAKAPPSAAALANYTAMLWKAGAKTPAEFLQRTAGMKADPSLVTVPFLSILGGGDSPVFAAQARDWHDDIRSTCKKLVYLDAATGADGHCQVNNRRRLAQEACVWMDGIFGRGV